MGTKGRARLRILGGQGGGANSQQAHDVVTTSMRRSDVASTSFRRHAPTRFLINQCQIIAFPISKCYIIQNPRIELKGIVLPVPSNLIKVTFIIIFPFSLVHMYFFHVSHRNCRKCGWIIWGGGYVAPPLLKLLGGACPLPPPPPPPRLFLRLWALRTRMKSYIYQCLLSFLNDLFSHCVDKITLFLESLTQRGEIE